MMDSFEFMWPIRVYYEDTDTAGVVYHGRYLNFMERARTEWLRAKGIEQDQLRANLGIILTITALSIRYLQAIRFNQQLKISVELEKIRRASMVLHQKIFLVTEKNTPLVQACEASVTVAFIDEASFKPVVMPEPIKKEILSEC